MNHLRFKLLCSCAGLAVTFGTAAAAQDGPGYASEATQVEEVVVTGSRFARSDLTSAAPVTVVSSEAILESGSVFISETLRRDPALGSASRGPSNTLNGAGAVGADIRNLGARRTLVLVNGRRYPIYSDAIGNAGQDIGGIPTAFIERVEVLRDGASTAYGADAVAGVVNFILKDGFDGAEVEAYTGLSERGDGFAYRVSGIIGSQFDGGSIVLTGQYQEQDEIPQSERGWARDLVQSLAGSGQINAPITNGGQVRGPGGALLACYPIAGGANIAPACEREDSSYASSLTLGSKIRSVGAVANYDLTSNVRASVDVFYSRRDSEQNIAAAQINTAALMGPYPSGFVIPAANANNPYGQDITLTWRPSAYGPRTMTASSEQFWASFGLSGKVFSNFDWELAHTYGSTNTDQWTANQIDTVAFYNLINPSVCSTVAACNAVGPIDNIADLLSGSAPLTESQQAYMLVNGFSQLEFVSEQTLATIAGPLFSLPAGTVQGALGLEYRREYGRVSPGSEVRSGDLLGSFVFPTDASFTATEVFGELEVPLLANLPGVQSLDLNLQARYSDFSNFGGADTYKASLNYVPTDDVRFRFTYGTSFRAPDIVQVYGGGVGSNGNFRDPCNADGLRLTNATADANCAALGVPAGYIQSLTSLPQRSGGNPDLQPEQGETYTVGLVLTPRFLPNFSATIDYFNVEITDAISSGLIQQNLNNCYSAADFLSRASNVNDICYSFDQRSPGGALQRIINRPTNLAELSTSGVDFSARYSFYELPWSAGSLHLDLRGSWLESFDEGGVERVGKYTGTVDGRAAFPDLRANLSANYDHGPWAVRWTANYTPSMDDSLYGTSIPTNNFLNYSGTPSYVTHDLLFRADINERVAFRFGVNNLLDKDPPYAFVTTRNTLTTVFDQIGRYYFTSVSLSF